MGRPPNVAFLLSDDQRADTIGALGNRHIRTPNLDRLVNRGFTFTHAFNMGSAVPAVCVPSRAMLLTGRSLYRSLAPITNNVIPRRAALWPEEFRKAGYATAGIGKWHNDRASYARCFTAGGPIFFGGMSSNHNKLPVYNYDPSGRYSTNQQRVASVNASELFANAAISFIRTQSTTNHFCSTLRSPRRTIRERLRRISRRFTIRRKFRCRKIFDHSIRSTMGKWKCETKN